MSSDAGTPVDGLPRPVVGAAQGTTGFTPHDAALWPLRLDQPGDAAGGHENVDQRKSLPPGGGVWQCAQTGTIWGPER